MCPAPLRGLTILDSQVRVALFAEWDLDAPGGLRTTTAGLVDHSPDDIHVVPYLNQPGFSSLLRVNELIARLQRQRIELIHIASCGHVALLALLLAAKRHLPLVGSFDLDSLTTTALRRRYLRTLSEVCHAILVYACHLSRPRARFPDARAAGIRQSTHRGVAGLRGSRRQPASGPCGDPGRSLGIVLRARRDSPGKGRPSRACGRLPSAG